MTYEVPYDELDPPIVGLVQTLNGLPGVETIGSCGGHDEPMSGASLPANRWSVTFRLEAADPDALVALPTPDAWMTLEFLAWVVNHDWWKARKNVGIRMDAGPPFLNFPGRMLVFVLEGDRAGDGGIDPDEVAQGVADFVDRFYVPADQAWGDEPLPDTEDEA